MPEYSLSVYRFSIKEAYKERYINITNTNNLLSLMANKLLTEGNRPDEEDLNSQKFPQNGEKAFEIFSPSPDNYRNVLDFIEVKDVEKNERPFYQYIFFGVKYGEFGSEAEIVKVNDKKKKPRIQAVDEAAMKPYYVMIALPYGEEAKHGIIVYQNTGAYGVKTLLEPALKRSVKVISPSYTVGISAVAQYDRVKALLDNFDVQKLKLVEYYKNSSDKTESKYDKRELLYTKVSRVYSNFLKEHLKVLAKDPKAKVSNIVDLSGFEPDEVSATFEVDNGKPLTVRFSNLDSLRYSEVIPQSEIRVDKNNSLIPRVVEEIMCDKVKEYVELIYKISDVVCC